MNHSTMEMKSHVVDIMMIRIFLHQKNRPYFTSELPEATQSGIRLNGQAPWHGRRYA